MKNIITIMSKEFTRFFTDKRMVLMTILPAVLIYVVYTFMGTMMARVVLPDEYATRVFAVNAPASITQVLQAADIRIENIGANETPEAKERLINKEADLLMIFPADFDALVEVYDLQTAAGPAPNIEMYFLSTEPNSATAYHQITAILDLYETSLVNKFDINRDNTNADLATAEDVAASIISMIMPMLLFIFLFSGCMGLALESITGEKERGTLATLLVSPLKRSELAIGKILSLAVLSFLSGLVTAIATILALPNLMGGGTDGMVDVNIYSITDYILLALIILTVLLVMVAMVSIVSAFAKTLKEAGQATMPLMIVVMLVGVSGMFGGGVPTEPFYYMIPLYGSVQSMSGIFSLEYSTVNIIVACISNLVFACIGGYILTKMFNSEKVMFSK
ncbi:MAG: ABC transporter permease subunit [Oscillospiraceae bacterium]|nr:ABC transporter permease subunit [Oscillospiraceae bacterium]